MNLLMRDVTIQDSLDLLQWRNEIIVRIFSRSQGLISEQAHTLWLKSRLQLLPDEPFWLFENASEKIGLVRFDFNKELNHFEISITINPLFRGMGYGKMILNQAIEKCSEDNRRIIFQAEIHENNQTSISLFLNSGFHEFEKRENFLVFKRITNSN